jgi:hypothetical protein
LPIPCFKDGYLIFINQEIEMLKFRSLKNIATSVMAIVGIMVLGCALVYASKDAPDIGNIQHTLSGSTKTVMKMIMLVGAIAGLALVAMALFSFKAASDSAGQQNNNMQKGVVKLIIGGALISLPFMLQVSQNSVMGTGMSTSGITIPDEAEAYKTTGYSSN